MMNCVLTKPEQELSDLCRKVNSTICSSNFATVDRLSCVSARFEGVQLGPVNVFKYEGQGVRGATRNIHQVRANPVDEFLIFMPLSRSMSLSQSNRQCIVGPGGFGILSSLRPYEVYCGDPPNHEYSELFAKVPGSLLRNHVPLLDEYCAVPLHAGQAAGRMLNVMIETILAEGRHFNEAQTRMFRSMLVDAIGVAALDAPETSALYESLCLTGHARVRLQATDYVEANLSNPVLDAAMVARGCQVSLRRLHEAFASSTTTVGMLIRQMRMERCRNDLRNPAMKGQSAIQIAMRWGFSSSASFTRSYRAHFGKTPSDERRASQIDESRDTARFKDVENALYQDSAIAL